MTRTQSELSELFCRIYKKGRSAHETTSLLILNPQILWSIDPKIRCANFSKTDTS